MKTAENIKNCHFPCKGENAKKYIFFLLRKKMKNNKGKIIYHNDYSLRFLDSARFMNVSLDTLLNNLSEETYNKK